MIYVGKYFLNRPLEKVPAMLDQCQMKELYLEDPYLIVSLIRQENSSKAISIRVAK